MKPYNPPCPPLKKGDLGEICEPPRGKHLWQTLYVLQVMALPRYAPLPAARCEIYPTPCRAQVCNKEAVMQVEPYLFFEGRCEEALDFYHRSLGVEVTMLMRFKESPDPNMCPSGFEDKVMHTGFSPR